MIASRARRERVRSMEIVERAVTSGDPFSYLYEHMDEMRDVIFDDFMYLFRAYPPINITSHDIVDAYERNAHREARHASMWWDIIFLLRNKGSDGNTVSK